MALLVCTDCAVSGAVIILLFFSSYYYYYLGTIPSSIGWLTSVSILDASDNNLSGCFSYDC